MMMRVSFKRLTNEVFNSAADFLLWYMGFLGTSMGKSKTARGAYKAICEANEFLSTVNHETLRGSWQKLKRQGFIDLFKEKGFYKPVVTALGQKRLKTGIPYYQEKRPWDRKIYIITYDIPEEKASFRDFLREAIKRLGGAYLQQSVWICPYNIKDILNEMVREKHMEGTIIISNTGKDGTIGDQSIEELLIDVYHLESLNEKYKEFLSMVDERKNKKQELITSYLAILKEDQQLPFELLPYWWLGDEAHREYKKLLI